MIYDRLLTFMSGTNAASSITSSVVDLGQAEPRLGLIGRPLFIVVRPNDSYVATTTTVAVYDSADNSTFACLETTSAMSDFEGVVIPVPVDHKRYLRLNLTLTAGTGVTLAGKLNAFITDNLQDWEKATREIA